MKKLATQALGLAAFVAVLGAADEARAQCCPGHTLTTSCATAPTKSRWCIANDAPNGFGTATLPAVFCSWGDQVVTTLEDVFNIPAPGVFEFDLMTCTSNGGTNCTPGQSTGGAQTPTDCGTFGNSVTFDAFTGNAYSAMYFWGYLLSLHEAINQWTGLASGGWPTDWWADHVSAFPNVMDFHVMSVLGTTNADNNLLTASAAQKARFYPGGDSADPRVVALDDIYGMMPSGNGLAGFSHVFSMVSKDGMSWGDLGSNPNQKLSEYVLAYIALAVGQPGSQVLPTAQGPSANMGGNICNGFQDASGDPTYTCKESDIDAIATAHCTLAANGKPAADLSAFKSGDYASVKMGPCGSTCPAECGCQESTGNCVAPWIAMNGGSGIVDGGGDATTGSSGSSGSGSGSGSGSSSGGGQAPDSGGASGGSSGGGHDSGAGTHDGGGASNGDTSPSSSSGGCGCRAPGGTGESPIGIVAVGALAALAVARGRRGRR